MYTMKHITVRALRQKHLALAGDWVAFEVEKGYTVRCGDSVLYTINGGKPRVFRSLDSVKQTLAQEIGITEFKVEAMKV
jgi:hypothetical protein